MSALEATVRQLQGEVEESSKRYSELQLIEVCHNHASFNDIIKLFVYHCFFAVRSNRLDQRKSIDIRQLNFRNQNETKQNNRDRGKARQSTSSLAPVDVFLIDFLSSLSHLDILFF